MKVVGRYGEGVLESVPDEIERLERLGYDALTTGELRNEATMRWTLAAHASKRAEIGMSVMIAFPRSPFVTAQMAWGVATYDRRPCIDRSRLAGEGS